MRTEETGGKKSKVLSRLREINGTTTMPVAMEMKKLIQEAFGTEMKGHVCYNMILMFLKKLLVLNTTH